MAIVLPFPSSHRLDRVERVARAMASRDPEEAERYLVQQLAQEQGALKQRHITQDRIDDELIRLDRAIRSRLWHEIISRPGGGAA